MSAIIGLISQGPEAIRKIPEIPAAVSETIDRVWEAHQIDRGLTGTWRVVSLKASDAATTPDIRLELESKGGQVEGALYSPVIRNWTIYDMALIEGYRDGRFLRVTVFDFVGGKRTKLADLSLRFQTEPDEGITDHVPPLVEDVLEVEAVWQLKPALPKKFALAHVAS